MEGMSWKKVYFAFRALEIGSQLARDGRVTDFAAANHWYERARSVAEFLGVKQTSEGWDIVQAAFAHEFQQSVQHFCALVDGDADLSPSAEAHEVQAVCKLCGMQAGLYFPP